MELGSGGLVSKHSVLLSRSACLPSPSFLYSLVSASYTAGCFANFVGAPSSPRSLVREVRSLFFDAGA